MQIPAAGRGHRVRRPVRPGLRLPIMTDFADGVEQNRVMILGDGSQVEQDKPLLDAGHDRRIALPQGPGQLGFRVIERSETGAKRRRPRVGIGCTGALPPPMNDSAGTTAAFNPSSERKIAASFAGACRQTRQAAW